ncbi:MAG: hypothetical protein Roseis2KO_34440 [Roseivirga sp.]
MKTFLISLSLLALTAFTSAPEAEINKEVTVNGLTYLYGEINREGLTSGTYNSWFSANYNRYQPDEQKLANCTEGSLEGITVKLLMATWCGDSKRNVPVFYKIMDTLGFDEEQLQIWALDRRKQGPNNEQTRFGVTRVPTIIFYRDDVEIGRFVERLKPGQNMEDIILGFVNG